MRPGSSARTLRPVLARASARLLLLSSCASMLLLLGRLVSGGFALHLGAVRLSVHGWTGPVALAAIGWLAARALDPGDPWRRALVEAARSPARTGPAVAIAASICAAAAANALGTHAASGADASGYVSQAALWRTGIPQLAEPLASTAQWPDAAWTLSPLGYRPGTELGSLSPTYPPGLPLLMAIAWAVGGSSAVFLVVPLCAAAAVVFTFLLGRTLHSDGAGACAAVVLASSPVFLFQALQPMSDVPVTALWTGALVAAVGGSRFSAGTAGLLAGVAVLTRPNLAPLVLPVAALALRGGGARSGGPIPASSRARRTLVFATPVVAAVGTVLLLNAEWYGSPFRSGYGSVGDLFSIASIRPNLVRYAIWLLETQTPLIALAAAAPVLLRRASPGCGARRPALLFAGFTLVAINFAAYLPYAVFEQWDYLRFLLPSLPFLVAATWGTAWALSERIAAVRRWQWPTLLFVALLLARWQVDTARDRDAFRLATLERRYIATASWITGAVPTAAVVVTAQQSGSIRFLSGRSILRWDLLHPAWLDRTVGVLAARDRPPIIVIEAWEEPAFKARFAGQLFGALDWPPTAVIAAATPVRVYDPRDRARFLAGQGVRTERVFDAR